jgi:hypothetical protein
MSRISERRKPTTAAEFRSKAASLRKVADDLEREEARHRALAMADEWEAKALRAEAASPAGDSRDKSASASQP